jgi:hypothetical protein
MGSHVASAGERTDVTLVTSVLSIEYIWGTTPAILLSNGWWVQDTTISVGCDGPVLSLPYIKQSPYGYGDRPQPRRIGAVSAPKAQNIPLTADTGSLSKVLNAR